MRITLVSMFVLCASSGFAIPVLAPPAPACSGFGSGPANDISIQFATWTAPNFFCEQNDKIFSNFSVGAGLPTNTVLELQMQSLAGLDIHGVTFNGNFLTAFTLSYDIAIDLTQFNGNNRIVRVSGDLSNPERGRQSGNSQGRVYRGQCSIGHSNLPSRLSRRPARHQPDRGTRRRCLPPRRRRGRQHQQYVCPAAGARTRHAGYDRLCPDAGRRSETEA